MNEILAPVSGITFDLEVALVRQLGSAIFSDGPSHAARDRSVVCKHWLRGLCKKAAQCEFLHVYDVDRMPQCQFYVRDGVCNNKDCQFQHVDPETTRTECPWYERGFCKHGMACRHRHTRRVACQNYITGFCPDGPACAFAHPKWELPYADGERLQGGPVVCHAWRARPQGAAVPHAPISGRGRAADTRTCAATRATRWHFCRPLPHAAQRCRRRQRRTAAQRVSCTRARSQASTGLALRVARKHALSHAGARLSHVVHAYPEHLAAVEAPRPSP